MVEGKDNSLNEACSASPSPLVSIIIPCYNAEKYVAEAIQSALDQTYSNCEVIVIDDGSTDGSLDVIKSFGDKIKWETGPNRGGCAARNRGFDLSRGEWIQYLDADDALHSEKIQHQMKLAISRKDAIIDSKVIFVHDDSTRLAYSQYCSCDLEIRGVDYFIKRKTRTLQDELQFNNAISSGYSYTISWLTPRNLIEKVGEWDVSLKILQDHEYFHRILLSNVPVVFSGKAISFYRTSNPGSITKVVSHAHAESHLRVVKNAEKFLSEYDSENFRLAIGRMYFTFLRKYQMLYPSLSNECHQAIDRLGLPGGAEMSSPKLRTLSKFFGRKYCLYFLFIRQAAGKLRRSRFI